MKIIRCVSALISLSVLLMLSACSDSHSDEAMIQMQIDNLQTAIENHSRSDFMAVIDEEYQDQLNNDKKSLQRMLMGFFYRYKDISVYTTATQIEVNQIRAEAQSQVVVTGGKGLLPENGRHYQVLSCWKKVSDEWLLSCLEWE